MPSSYSQSSTRPATHVTVPPATQIVPSSSRETCTRPARPSAAPWLATYGAVARPVRSSQSASDAFRLPVTGSSAVEPAFGKNARTSNAAAEPGGWAPTTSEVEVDEAGPEREHRLG